MDDEYIYFKGIDNGERFRTYLALRNYTNATDKLNKEIEIQVKEHIKEMKHLEILLKTRNLRFTSLIAEIDSLKSQIKQHEKDINSLIPFNPDDMQIIKAVGD